MQIAIGILAAGASRRLGQPKQLLPWKGGNLLNHTIKQCLKLDFGNVFVIIGANSDQIKPELCTGNYTQLTNNNWEEGMNSSIRAFLGYIDASVYDGILILVGDQPFLSTQILSTFFDVIIEGKEQIIVSRYDRGKGPPSYFSYHFFDALTRLQGDTGAKAIVESNKDLVRYINFPQGSIDIDSAKDVEQWL